MLCRRVFGFRSSHLRGAHLFSHMGSWIDWLTWLIGFTVCLCSPWRRCHKIPRCCSETVCWDKPVRRTGRRQRPDLSPSSRRLSRCSANLWGSWSSLSLLLPSSWTWSPFQPRVSRTLFSPNTFPPWSSAKRRQKFSRASRTSLCVKRA